MPQSPTPGRYRRRSLLGALLGAAGAGILARPAAASVLTPEQTEGPFYPTGRMRHADADNDLVRIAGAVRRAGGQVVRLEGRILDRSGSPVEGARVEIWQCDVNGRYLHHGDRGRGDHDPAFQGFGHDITDADGRYRFRTIRPVAYPGRTPHIHVKVFAGERELTTQFYLAGEPANARDGIYRRLSPDERKAVSMQFAETGDEPRAEVDIVL